MTSMELCSPSTNHNPEEQTASYVFLQLLLQQAGLPFKANFQVNHFNEQPKEQEVQKFTQLNIYMFLFYMKVWPGKSNLPQLSATKLGNSTLDLLMIIWFPFMLNLRLWL